MFRIAALLLLSIAFCGTARAQYVTPESGWYWNSAASGSGFNIEFQDSTMFLSFFGYNQARQSTFYTVQGVIDVGTGRVAGDLFALSNGQCIGCPYNPPTVTSLGTATVQFLTRTRANITLPTSGGPVTLPVERFVFAYNPNLAGRDIGAWFTTIVFTNGSLPDGDIVRIRTTQNGPSGIVSRGDLFPSNRTIVGGNASIQGTSYNYAWLIDFSPTTDAYYIGEFSVNGFFGEYFIVPKATIPVGVGVKALGARLAGPNSANQILGVSSGGDTGDLEAASSKRLANVSRSARPKAAQRDLEVVALRLQQQMTEAKR